MTEHLHAGFGRQPQGVVEHTRALVGTDGGQRFERVARFAASTLSAPIAAILLADEGRSSLLALYGKQASWASTDRDAADFLNHIGTSSPHTVSHFRGAVRAAENATTPEPYSYLAPVTERFPDARSLAAQHLMVDGVVVGAMIVLDIVERTYSAKELSQVDDIAQWASAELRAQGERRSRDQLQGLTARTDTILASVAEGVVGIDPDGRCEFINPAGCAILGWEEHELVGEIFHNKVHYRRPDGSAYPWAACPVSEVLQTGHAKHNLTETYFRKDGTPVAIDWSLGPVQAHDGRIGVAMVFADVSHRVALEEMRSRFMSVVSHEMRTPLTSLLGALRLVDGGAAGEVGVEIAPLVTIAVRNGARLAKLIDDVLDAERAGSGTMQLKRTLIDVHQLLTQAAHTIEGVALATDIAVDVEPCDVTVWGDEHRLLQVLTNLMGNAVRFSPRGGTVRLRAARYPTEIHLCVSDEGPGISAEDANQIFEPFWQIDASDARSHSGSGLGLSIAHSIVSLHGGRIEIDSSLGEGSTFTVVLPIRSQDMAVPFNQRGTDTRGRP